MTHTPRPFPAAQPHGELAEVLPGMFFVTGGIKFPGRPIRFSRNMVILREGERLVLVNTLRLGDAGLAALDKLGKVTDVIRIGANHGMDDPFYADRYAAKVWVVKGQRYTAGFNAQTSEPYFTPHVEIDATTALPLANARLLAIRSSPPEGVLLLPQHGGVAITADALQNWDAPDAYFNWFARFMMRRMGFIKAHNVGPGWLGQGKPPKEDLRAILDLPFTNVLPGHGKPVLGNAVERFRPAIDRVTT